MKFLLTQVDIRVVLSPIPDKPKRVSPKVQRQMQWQRPIALARRIDYYQVLRWVAYALLALSLTSAVLLSGGVYASQWQWIAVGIALGSCLCLSVPARRAAPQATSWEMRIMGLLLLWMGIQLTPLPPAAVRFLSPERWNTEITARMATGFDLGAWLPLSVAPGATLERLLYVVPAMAVFIAASEMARWWRSRYLWRIVAPVICAACLESLLGLTQFFSVRAAGPESNPVSGSYVNRNHFAGLLEMAFPLAVMWAIAIWMRASRRREPSALKTSTLLVISGCILVSVIASLSRMGFAATLVAMAIIALAWMLAWGRKLRFRGCRLLWLLPLVLPLATLVFVSTNAMVLRFASLPQAGELTTEGRIQIWKETAQMIHTFKWAGCGLGAFEHGLFRFRTFAPTNTVDFAHNDYLQILAELGIVGFVLIGALMIRIFRPVLSVALTPDSRHWALAVGLLGSFIAIGLHSLVDFNLYIPANALALAWLAGVATSPGLTEA